MNKMQSPTTIRVEVPRVLTREEMELVKKKVAEVAGEVRKVSYPTDHARIEK